LNWSWQVGKVSGIPIRIHITFLALPALFAVGGWANAGIAGAVRETVFVLGVFLCIVLHELGHSLAALNFGIQVRDITLLPIGGLSRLARIPRDPKEEILLSLAGPVVNVIIAGGLLVGLLLRPAVSPWQGISLFGPHLLARLMWANALLAAFNLLPAFPMDGGRILRGTLALFIPRTRATRIAAMTGRVMAGLFLLAGILSPAFRLLIFIAIFVYMGAAAEEQQARIQERFSGLKARDAMIAPFDFFWEQDPLGVALDRASRTFQEDFPVFGDRGALGFISRSELQAGAAVNPWGTAVGHLVSRGWVGVPAEAPLEDVFLRLQAGGLRTVGVEEGGQVVGLINDVSLTRAMELLGAVPAGPQ